jgi:hypothetical protein
MSSSNEQRARFLVIEGDGQPRAPWLTFPSSIIARSIRDDGSTVPYRASRRNIAASIENNRFQPVLDFWAGVAGQVPPINCLNLICQAASPDFALAGLAKAAACFRGLRRPVDFDDRGLDWAIFVSKPAWAFERNPSMKGPYSCYKVPLEFVFLTYVRLDPSTEENQNWRAGKGAPPPSGCICHWRFEEADPAQQTLPLGYRERFQRQAW